MTIMNIKVHISSSGALSHDRESFPSSPKPTVRHIYRVKLITKSIHDDAAFDKGFSDRPFPATISCIKPYYYYYQLLCDLSFPNKTVLNFSNLQPKISSNIPFTDDDSCNSDNASHWIGFKNYRTSRKFNHQETFPKNFSDEIIGNVPSLFQKSNKRGKRNTKNFEKRQNNKKRDKHCISDNDGWVDDYRKLLIILFFILNIKY